MQRNPSTAEIQGKYRDGFGVRHEFTQKEDLRHDIIISAFLKRK